MKIFTTVTIVPVPGALFSIPHGTIASKTKDLSKLTTHTTLPATEGSGASAHPRRGKNDLPVGHNHRHAQYLNPYYMLPTKNPSSAPSQETPAAYSAFRNLFSISIPHQDLMLDPHSASTALTGQPPVDAPPRARRPPYSMAVCNVSPCCFHNGSPPLSRVASPLARRSRPARFTAATIL